MVASNDDDAETGYIRLQVLAEASAGTGRIVEPELISHVDVLESWARKQFGGNPATLRLLTVRGRSMTGVVEDGDILFVRSCTTFDGDGLYVLCVDDLLFVKRLSVRVLDQHLVIESTDGRPAEVGRLDDVGTRIIIQAQVVGAWGLKLL